MFESRRGLLEAAHLVHHKFWGNKLDELLQPVPDCNFKYFTEELINSLSLRRHLLYNEAVLLVRREYLIVYKDLVLWENKPKARGGGVVILGQPGIGAVPLTNSVSFANNQSRKNLFPVLSLVSPLK
jgi:hypothetical protein